MVPAALMKWPGGDNERRARSILARKQKNGAKECRNAADTRTLFNKNWNTNRSRWNIYAVAKEFLGCAFLSRVKNSVKKYIYFFKSSKTHIEIGKSEAQCSAADADGQIPSQVSPTTLSSSTQRRLWQLKNVFRRERKIPFFFTFFFKISHFSRFFISPPLEQQQQQQQQRKKKVDWPFFFGPREGPDVTAVFGSGSRSWRERPSLATWRRGRKKNHWKKNDFRTKKSYIEYGIQFIQVRFLFPLSFF